jgi:iron(III) transport system permease protein
VLGASKIRVFFTVTLPGAKYGLISASLVVFTLVITDFGIAKVIGGNFNVLATDVYKQVIGQQNFSMGAVVGMVLLAPAALRLRRRPAGAAQAGGAADRARRAADPAAQARPRPLLHAVLHASSRRHPAHPRHGGVGLADQVLAVQSQPHLGELQVRDVRRQRLGLLFQLARHGGGRGGVRHGADVHGRLAEREDQGFFLCAPRAAARLPADGGARLVLGLGYIFFFNAPHNPLNFLYATMAILVINTVAHFYTVGHLTATTALKQIDPEFESVSASLKVPIWRTFGRVTVPICLPAILDIAIYLFVNAMTTVSSVIFLYRPTPSSPRWRR